MADSTDAATDRFQPIMEMQKLLYLVRHIFTTLYMLHIFIHHGCSFLTPGVSFTKIKDSFIGKSIMK